MNKVAKKIGMLVASFTAVAVIMAGSHMQPVYAANDVDCGDAAAKEGLNRGVHCGQGESTPSNLLGDGSIVNTVINTMLFIVGILSVIMIIFSGIRYVTAHGDKSQVESAKNTLIYAIVGLVVAIVAYALVNWVTTLFIE